MSKHPYRWPCSVPGCRCTIGANRPTGERGDWALCRKHWPLVPRQLKAMIRRAWKRLEKAWAAFGGVGHRSTWLAWRHADAAYDRLCRLAVRKACERALGIG